LILTEIESKQVLSEAGISVVETKLAESNERQFPWLKLMGYPVVLKISSPDITHKSDVNGVRVGIKTKEEVSQVFGEIIAAAKANFLKPILKEYLSREWPVRV